MCPAVRTVELVGIDRFYDTLRQLGLDSLTEPADFYGASLALGGADVTLLTLANAYRALANGGAMERDATSSRNATRCGDARACSAATARSSSATSCPTAARERRASVWRTHSRPVSGAR